MTDTTDLATASASDSSTNKHLAVARRVIQQESEALAQLAGSLGGEFQKALDLIVVGKARRVVVTGMGKSGHIARKIAATLASTGTRAVFIHPAEASHGDLGMIDTGDVILALSRSGEAPELSDILAYATRFEIPLIAITAKPESQLGKAATVNLLIPDLPEATPAVNAPTTSTTMQLAMGDALAVALLENRGFNAANFQVYHPGGKLGAMLRRVGDLMHGEDELPLVQAGAGMPEVLLTITQKRFGCAGVCDEGGELVGIITDGDIRRHLENLLDSRAEQVMTASPITTQADALASDTLRIMNQSGISALFVVEDGRPIGILHLHDLLRAGVI